jgi:hypothetical protein
LDRSSQAWPSAPADETSNQNKVDLTEMTLLTTTFGIDEWIDNTDGQGRISPNPRLLMLQGLTISSKMSGVRCPGASQGNLDGLPRPNPCRRLQLLEEVCSTSPTNE